MNGSGLPSRENAYIIRELEVMEKVLQPCEYKIRNAGFVAHPQKYMHPMMMT